MYYDNEFDYSRYLRTVGEEARPYMPWMTPPISDTSMQAVKAMLNVFIAFVIRIVSSPMIDGGPFATYIFPALLTIWDLASSKNSFSIFSLIVLVIKNLYLVSLLFSPYGIVVCTTLVWVHLLRKAHSGLRMRKIEDVDSNGVMVVTRGYVTTSVLAEWFFRIMVPDFKIDRIGVVTNTQVPPAKTMYDQVNWTKDLYKHFTRPKVGGDHVERESAGNSDELGQILSSFAASIEALSNKVDSLTNDVPPVYELVPAIASPDGIKVESLSYNTIRFLNEKNEVIKEAGSTMFSTNAGQSVLRVYKDLGDGKYEGWATAFKCGNDKICTSEHTHFASSKHPFKLGQPMLDDVGNPLVCIVPLKDGVKAHFSLIPYYRSNKGEKDLVFCHLPVVLRSLIPGLKARKYDADADVEVGILGFPINSDHLKFSTSEVTDNLHMAGSSTGVSGAPILSQGRTTIGVHVGRCGGDQKKRFHPYTDEDLEAYRLPAPVSCPVVASFTGGGESPRKKKAQHRNNKEYIRIDDDPDYEPDLDEHFYRESASTPKSPAPVDEVLTLLKQLLKEKVVIAEAGPGIPKKDRKKKKKGSKSPCPNILQHGFCQAFATGGACSQGGHELQQEKMKADQVFQDRLSRERQLAIERNVAEMGPRLAAVRQSA